MEMKNFRGGNNLTVRRVQHATAGQNGDETLRTRSIISCWNLKVFSSKWSFNNNKKKQNLLNQTVLNQYHRWTIYKQILVN